MIIGVILRNYKTYRNITYIPISNGERFCGLVGKNGAGKSSVFEALDFFFNKGKEFCLNINANTTEDRYVVPLFLLEKAKYQFDDPTLEKYSDTVWDVLTGDLSTITINVNYQEVIKSISAHINEISSHYSKKSHYLVPLGMHENGCTSIAVFRDNVFMDAIVENKGDSTEEKVKYTTGKLSASLEKLKSLFQYVFIPKDVEAERLIQFETAEIQTIIGSKLKDIVSAQLHTKDIEKISKGLKEFVDELSKKLQNYVFKTPSTRQPNLKADNLYNLIIREFFSIRELHKKVKGAAVIPLKSLSSGEKQQAILSVIYNIVSGYRDSDTNSSLIIAVDEPEASLHISACFEQFEKLYKLSEQCGQVLFASHWYGFIPAMSSGSITNITISDKADKRNSNIFNIKKYREEIIQREKNEQKSKRTKEDVLPIDIILKSSNDFVQSVLMSVISENYYNWLICEGSSDKVYLDAYFSKEIINNRLRIVPVCAASEIKNTYNLLSVSFQTVKKKLKGKVFLLTDTDTKLLKFQTLDSLEEHLNCRRLVNNNTSQNTELVKIESTTISPKTEIEDSLNGCVFNKTLIALKQQYPDMLDFIEDVDKEDDDKSSFYAMNLRINEYEKLDNFFNAHSSQNKVLFAEKYVEILSKTDKVPSWINEIKKYFDFKNTETGSAN